jgi:hypothetical protein
VPQAGDGQVDAVAMSVRPADAGELLRRLSTCDPGT